MKSMIFSMMRQCNLNNFIYCADKISAEDLHQEIRDMFPDVVHRLSRDDLLRDKDNSRLDADSGCTFFFLD